jgi:hypothetical protein
MSLSGLIFWGMCFASYKLGVYRTKSPGELERHGKLAWSWLCNWLSK